MTTIRKAGRRGDTALAAIWPSMCPHIDTTTANYAAITWGHGSNAAIDVSSHRHHDGYLHSHPVERREDTALALTFGFVHYICDTLLRYSI